MGNALHGQNGNTNRWHTQDAGRLTGIGKYELRDPHPNALAALDALYRRGWLQDIWSLCDCGQRIHTGNGIRCKPCTDRCDHLAVRGYDLLADGRAAPRQYCGWCGAKMVDPPRARYHGHSWICPIRFKNNQDTKPPEPCERCGAIGGTQLHHWAPRAIFSDADEWPTAWLCIACHRFWHSTIQHAAGFRLDQPVAIIPTQRTFPSEVSP